MYWSNCGRGNGHKEEGHLSAARQPLCTDAPDVLGSSIDRATDYSLFLSVTVDRWQHSAVCYAATVSFRILSNSVFDVVQSPDAKDADVLIASTDSRRV